MNIKNILLKPFYNTKYYHQRARRGFSDKDMWNADMYLAGLIADILRWYITEGVGVPSSYAKEDDPLCEDFDYMKAAMHIEYSRYIALFDEYAEKGIVHDEKWKRDFGGLTKNEVSDMMTWLAEHFTELWD